MQDGLSYLRMVMAEAETLPMNMVSDDAARMKETWAEKQVDRRRTLYSHALSMRLSSDEVHATARAHPASTRRPSLPHCHVRFELC